MADRIDIGFIKLPSGPVRVYDRQSGQEVYVSDQGVTGCSKVLDHLRNSKAKARVFQTSSDL